MKKQYIQSRTLGIYACMFAIIFVLSGCPMDPATPADTSAPVIRTASLSGSSVDFSINQIVLTFSEAIRAVSGTITLTGGAMPQTFTIGTTATVSGNTITLTGVMLEEATEYSIQIPANIVRDAAGNANTAVSGNTIQFTTIRDSQPPSIQMNTAISASKNADNNTTTITIAFSEAINIVDGQEANIGLTSGTGASATTISNAITPTVNSAPNINQLVLTVAMPLLAEGDYTLSIGAGVIQDRAQTPNPTPADITRDFTIDTIAPALSPSIIPIYNASSREVSISFSEEITIADSGGISLVASSDTSTTIPASPALRSGNARELVLTLESDPEDGDYTIRIAEQAIRDEAGNTNSSELSANLTINTSAPSVANRSFTLSSTNNQAITVVFDKEITLLNASGITISDGPASHATSITTGSIQIVNDSEGNANRALEIPLTSIQETDGSAYTITIAADAVADTAIPANNNVAISITLVVDATRPAYNRVEHDRSENTISIFFSEGISPVEATTGNITLTNTSDSTTALFDIGIAEQVGYENDSIILSGVVFTDTTNYTITIPADVVADTAGNNNAEISGTTIQFTTADTTGPAYANISDSVAFNANTRTVTIIFNETLQAGAGIIILSSGGSNQEFTVSTSTPPADGTATVSTMTLTLHGVTFTDSTSYTITIPRAAVADEADNDNAEIPSIQFMTSDVTRPMYVDDSVRFLNASRQIEMSFNETVTAGTGTITLSGGGSEQTFIVSGVSPTATVSDRVITLNNVTILQNSTIYTITIPEAVVMDNAGNNNAAITDNTIELTTEDVTGPVFVSASITGRRIDIRMNEPISEITDSGNLIVVTPSVSANTYPVDPSNRVVAGFINNQTISLGSAVIIHGTNYSITIPAGSFQDRAGNPNLEITGTGTGVDTSPPEIMRIVDSGGNTVITFTENIFFIRDASDTFRIVRTGDGTTLHNVMVNNTTIDNNSVRISGQTLTLVSITGGSNTPLRVAFNGGALRDNVNNIMRSGSFSYTSSF